MTGTQLPSLTVLICTAGRPHLLERALCSLRAGSELPDQLVIVDGGGNEGTAAEVVRRHEAAFRDVVLLRCRNRNLATSRNLGLPHCTGDVIAMTDDDAEVAPDWIAQIRREHAAHPSIGAIGGPVLGRNSDHFLSRVADCVVFPHFESRRPVHNLPGVNVAYKREALTAAGSFDETLFRGEDVDFNERIRQAGFEVIYEPCIRVTHQHRPTVLGLLRQQYMYGRAYVRVRRAWPQMYAVYPRRLRSTHDALKAIHMVVAAPLYQPFFAARRMQSSRDCVAAYPLLVAHHLVWKLGMLRQALADRVQCVNSDHGPPLAAQTPPPAERTAHGGEYWRASDTAAQRSMHIVYVIAPGGGGESYVRRMAAGLQGLGQSCTILFVQKPHPLAHPVPDQFAAVERVFTGNAHWYYGRVRDLLPATMRRVLPDPKLVEMAEASAAVRWSLRRIEAQCGSIDLIEIPEDMLLPWFAAGRSYAVKLHGSEASFRHFCGEGLRPIDRLRLRVQAELLRRAALVSAPSHAVAKHIAEVCRYPRERIRVLPLPLDTEVFSPCQRTPDTPMQSNTVLFVGRLEPRKGIDTLARATDAILRAVPDTVIQLAGDGSSEFAREAFLAHISPRHHSRVSFLGPVAPHAMPELYRRATVCVFPSRWETFGYAVCEAMASGRPIVASALDAIAETVTDGEDGLLTPVGDHEALADAAITLLNDPARREIQGRAARCTVARRCSLDRIAPLQLDLYTRALLRMPERQVEWWIS